VQTAYPGTHPLLLTLSQSVRHSIRQPFRHSVSQSVSRHRILWCSKRRGGAVGYTFLEFLADVLAVDADGGAAAEGTFPFLPTDLFLPFLPLALPPPLPQSSSEAASSGAAGDCLDSAAEGLSRPANHRIVKYILYNIPVSLSRCASCNAGTIIPPSCLSAFQRTKHCDKGYLQISHYESLPWGVCNDSPSV
jgi:hypothetical protein